MTTTPTKRAPPRTFLRKVGHFLWHFVQMCLVMCAGGAILTFVFFGGAALLGYPDLFAQAPYLATLVLAINLSVAMVAWMRFRHHEWQPTLEMAGTSMATGIVLIALGSLGLVPVSDVFEWMTRLACPVMLVPMLFRVKLYTGSMDHHAHAA